MNVHVGHIARWQASVGRFAPKATPSPPPSVAYDSEDKDDDDGDDDVASDDSNEDASSTDEMSTWHSTLCHSWQKWGVVFNIRVVILRGRVSFWIIVLGGVLFFFWEM